MKDGFAAGLDAITLWNALAATFGQTLPLGGGARAVLQLAEVAASDGAAGEGAVFELATDAGPVFARLGPLPIGPMTQSTLDQAALEALPPALADAVQALCVDVLLRAAGPVVAGRVRSVTRRKAGDPAGEERLRAEVDGGWGDTATVTLQADRAVLVALARGLIQQGPGGALPVALAAGVPVPVSLRLAGRVVPLARLGGLRAGDILLAAGSAPVLAALHAWFGLVQDGSAWTIGEVVMSDDFPDPVDAAGDVAAQPEAGEIGDIPVRLSFVLSERVMTLADLQALSAGALLPFDAAPPETGQELRILANGKPIGAGNLVEVDGQPAVRIARLLGKG